VRGNLEAVNAHRASWALPPIDLASSIDAKRYGLDMAA